MSVELISIEEAAKKASEYLNKSVTTSNITYLIQYAQIKKHGYNQVDWNELKNYYDSNILSRENKWKEKLGEDLDWDLSFQNLREEHTTKHVHRLHPYKGKFIPQLVEYFLDSHLNTHKRTIYFEQGDIVLDPFMGSGTTLVQSIELGIHSIGIDISEFNCLIAKVKCADYDMEEVKRNLNLAYLETKSFIERRYPFNEGYNKELKNRISEFNNHYFPSIEYKQKVKNGEINEKEYGNEKLELFLRENNAFLDQSTPRLAQRPFEDYYDEKNRTYTSKVNTSETNNSFISKWFTLRIRDELNFYIQLIENYPNENIKNLMKLIISRTARSCRATTHSDLATLRNPQKEPYYCTKHLKICTPIHSILPHLKKNTTDAITRIEIFSKVKKNSFAEIIHGDSRTVNIFDVIQKNNPKLYEFLLDKKIDGIFTSPPYVGQIDYHDQHAYAYELFNINRRDEDEIGPLFKGKGKKAQAEYVEGISKVLRNISNFIKDDGNYFIVANDNLNLYPEIAKKSGLKIVDTFKRPVLNRTERDRQPYAETIFHMKRI